jgi:peptidoglycan/LPS O-acetylase OafA/YrhL
MAFLDGIRGLAALYVVLHHAWLGTWRDFPFNPGPFWVGWLVYGHLGVAVFIVVSGFSLGMGPARNAHRLPSGVASFVRRRAWRILPPYWAALAFSCLVYGVVTRGVTGSVVTVKAVVVHAVLLQDLIDSPKPNGAFWSIAIEWQIYFLFPLVLLVRRWAGRGATGAAALGSAVCAHLLAQAVPLLAPLDHVVPQFFAMFVMGVVAADAVREPRGQRTPRLAVGAALWTALVVAAAVAGPLRFTNAYFWVDLAAGAATAACLAGLCDGRSLRLRAVLGSRPLAAMGRFSYSTYLIHAPILWLVSYRLTRGTGLTGTALFLLTAVVAVPVILICSYLFHRVFERPFMLHRSFRELRGSLPARGRRARPTALVSVDVAPAVVGDAIPALPTGTTGS